MLNLSGKTKLFFNIVIKLILTVIISCAVMFSLVFVMYKPTYEVKMGEKTLGYISDKAEVQKKIADFLQNGDKENVGYVILNEEPTYEFSFVKKDTYVDDEEVIAKVTDSCDIYYRVYGVNVDDEEKFVVDTIKEAQEIVDKINEEQKDYKKKGIVEISEKFVQAYKPVEDIEVAINDINKSLKENNDEYIKSQKVYTANSNYGAYSSTSTYTIPEDVLLAMQTENGSLSFIHPLNNAGVLTSRFGPRSRNNHGGIDIGAPTGTPIYVAEDGIVTYAGWYYGYGYLIKVQHANGYETYYGHCSSIVTTAGANVAKGTLIGYVGSTGNSTGPHLHFEVRVNGVRYNPEAFVY